MTVDVLKGVYSIMEDAIPQGCGYYPRISLHISLIMRPLIRLIPFFIGPLNFFATLLKKKISFFCNCLAKYTYSCGTATFRKLFPQMNLGAGQGF